jgi:hypothetical protein
LVAEGLEIDGPGDRPDGGLHFGRSWMSTKVVVIPKGGSVWARR